MFAPDGIANGYFLILGVPGIWKYLSESCGNLDLQGIVAASKVDDCC